MNNNTVINKKPNESQIRKREFLQKVSAICNQHGGIVDAGKNIVIVNTKKYDVTLKKRKGRS